MQIFQDPDSGFPARFPGFQGRIFGFWGSLKSIKGAGLDWVVKSPTWHFTDLWAPTLLLLFLPLSVSHRQRSTIQNKTQFEDTDCPYQGVRIVHRGQSSQILLFNKLFIDDNLILKRIVHSARIVHGEIKISGGENWWGRWTIWLTSWRQHCTYSRYVFGLDLVSDVELQPRCFLVLAWVHCVNIHVHLGFFVCGCQSSLPGAPRPLCFMWHTPISTCCTEGRYSKA